MNVYTGFKKYRVFIKKVKNKYKIVSNDKAFYEYYIDNDNIYETYENALSALLILKKRHNLERFDNIIWRNATSND